MERRLQLARGKFFIVAKTQRLEPRTAQERFYLAGKVGKNQPEYVELFGGDQLAAKLQSSRRAKFDSACFEIPFFTKKIRASHIGRAALGIEAKCRALRKARRDEGSGTPKNFATLQLCDSATFSKNTIFTHKTF